MRNTPSQVVVTAVRLNRLSRCMLGVDSDVPSLASPGYGRKGAATDLGAVHAPSRRRGDSAVPWRSPRHPRRRPEPRAGDPSGDAGLAPPGWPGRPSPTSADVGRLGPGVRTARRRCQSHRYPRWCPRRWSPTATKAGRHGDRDGGSVGRWFRAEDGRRSPEARVPRACVGVSGADPKGCGTTPTLPCAQPRGPQ